MGSTSDSDKPKMKVSFLYRRPFTSFLIAMMLLGGVVYFAWQLALGLTVKAFFFGIGQGILEACGVLAVTTPIVFLFSGRKESYSLRLEEAERKVNLLQITKIIVASVVVTAVSVLVGYAVAAGKLVGHGVASTFKAGWQSYVKPLMITAAAGIAAFVKKKVSSWFGGSGDKPKKGDDPNQGASQTCEKPKHAGSGAAITVTGDGAHITVLQGSDQSASPVQPTLRRFSSESKQGDGPAATPAPAAATPVPMATPAPAPKSGISPVVPASSLPSHMVVSWEQYQSPGRAPGSRQLPSRSPSFFSSPRVDSIEEYNEHVEAYNKILDEFAEVMKQANSNLKALKSFAQGDKDKSKKEYSITESHRNVWRQHFKGVIDQKEVTDAHFKLPRDFSFDHFDTLQGGCELSDDLGGEMRINLKIIREKLRFIDWSKSVYNKQMQLLRNMQNPKSDLNKRYGREGLERQFVVTRALRLYLGIYKNPTPALTPDFITARNSPGEDHSIYFNSLIKRRSSLGGGAGQQVTRRSLFPSSP